MQNTKKIIGLLTIALMLLLSFNIVLADADFSTAAEKLKILGIMTGDESSNFNSDSSLTRAQAATILIRVLGAEAEAKAYTVAGNFSDVNSDHWAVSYINFANNQGIIKGKSDGTFGPNDNVTHAQLVAMSIRSLGYSDSDLDGSWPTNYLKKASDLELFDELNTGDNSPAIRKDVAILIANLLNVPLHSNKANISVKETLLSKLVSKGNVSPEQLKKFQESDKPQAPTNDEKKPENASKPKDTKPEIKSGARQYIGIITDISEANDKDVEIIILDGDGEHSLYVKKADRERILTKSFYNTNISLKNKSDFSYFRGLFFKCKTNDDGYIKNYSVAFSNKLYAAKLYKIDNKNVVSLLTSDNKKVQKDACTIMFVAEAKITVDDKVYGVDDIELSKLSEIELVDDDIEDFIEATSDKATTIYCYLLEVDKNYVFEGFTANSLDDEAVLNGHEIVIGAILFDPNEVFDFVK